jgi:hypothetical protein
MRLEEGITMRRRIDNALEKITATVSAWRSVDTLTVLESGEDIYDPYFFLSLDVYYNGQVPNVREREQMFDYVMAFESSQVNRKDRFLFEDIPVRMEYKSITRFDSIIDGAADDISFRDNGTYMFYRLRRSRILYARSQWLEQVREKMNSFSPRFWNLLRDSFQARMEHFLSDLNAAVIRNDHYFYLTAAAGFVRSLCSVLFVINHRFEPSGRQMISEVLTLKRLPEPFEGRFLSFLREDGELSLDRKREIANLMAKSIINLT